jgi:hypothetical protein
VKGRRDPGPEEPRAEIETSRQRLIRWLSTGDYDFDELRDALRISPRMLDDELRHVARSLRGGGRRLTVVEPRCQDCGFSFPGRARRHFHPPARCPKCKRERISAPRFRIT